MQTNVNKIKQASTKQRKSWHEIQGMQCRKGNKPQRINKREEV